MLLQRQIIYLLRTVTQPERDTVMQLRRKISKIAAIMLSAAMIGAFGTAGYYSGKLPDKVRSENGRTLKIAEYPEISCCGYPVSDGSSASDHVTLSIFGAIPVKYVEVCEEETPVYAASGMPFGIKLLMKGVMVTGTADVEAENGEKVCPAEDAGIEKGDIICLADGVEVLSNEKLQSIISGSSGNKISLRIDRGGREFTTELQPVYSGRSGSWRGGMWVRDSIAGIGTMTFINKKTGSFAGLGHPICDADTGELVPVSSGEAVPVEVSGTKRGEKGIPGELLGTFRRGEKLGDLSVNNESGVYGRLSPETLDDLEIKEYPLGYRQDIKRGDAEIYTTIKGSKPKSYSIEIEDVDYNSDDSAKNMVIRITDPELLEATGGIVQGMSGSPVIQDGKLIGAVTHVFVADPTRGYAIFAENMASELER